MDILNHAEIADILKFELERRKSMNSSYSLRAYARSLNMSPGELSEVMRGIRPITLKLVKKLSQSIDFTKEEEEHLENLVAISRGQLDADEYFIDRRSLEMIELNKAKFHLISNWHYFAILNLFDCTDFKWSVNYLSSCLGISREQAKEAMQALIEVGIVEKKKSKVSVSKKNVFTGDFGVSKAVQAYHQSVLKKAIKSLEDQPIEKRHVSGIGLPIKHNEIDNVKKEIRKFEERILKKYSSEEADVVYQLESAFFQISHLAGEE